MSNESGGILVPGLVCLSRLPSNEKQQRDIFRNSTVQALLRAARFTS